MAIGGRVLAFTAAAILVAGTASVASAAPADAAGVAPADVARCGILWPWTSCWTPVIRSNGTYHRINYEMCAASRHYADWQIKDADNGVIVAGGRVPDNTCAFGTVHGLYGAYHAWIFNTRAGAFAQIDNR